MASKYGKVVFEYPVKELHGKICKHSDVIFGKNGLTGKLYTSRICNPSTEVTAKQLQHRQMFTNASNYAKRLMADTTKRQAAEVRWAQNGATRYKTLRTYLIGEFMAGNEVEE